MTPTSRPRHPELVSGSIPPLARRHRWQAQPHRQVPPFRVLGIDQVDLPLPAPILELLLANDGPFHVPEHLEMDEPEDGVARGEAGQQPFAMLHEPLEKVRRDANVNRAVLPVREKIDAGVALFPHVSERAEKWTLKQVQGDEEGTDLDLARHPELVSGSIGPQARESR
jgi:hypothetical protein